MSKVDEYARALRELDDPESYLLEHSGLPGPRGNIELARAAAEVCSSAELRRWASLDTDVAPTGSADEFLAFCGVVGLGRLLAEGNGKALAELRRHANDPRWRAREAVAMALQRWGSDEFEPLAAAMAEWASGSWLERRAAAAAFCEPALLTDAGRVKAVLAVLDEATAGVASARPGERRSEELKALRKGLGYCWSVAVAAAPEVGRLAFEALVERAAASGDRDLLGSHARTCVSADSSGSMRAGWRRSARGSAEGEPGSRPRRRLPPARASDRLVGQSRDARKGRRPGVSRTSAVASAVRA